MYKENAGGGNNDDDNDDEDGGGGEGEDAGADEDGGGGEGEDAGADKDGVEEGEDAEENYAWWSFIPPFFSSYNLFHCDQFTFVLFWSTT